MEDLLNWVSIHWAELLAAVGVGGGGGVIGKKLTYARQNSRITDVENKITDMEKQINGVSAELTAQNFVLVEIKSELDANTKFDKQLRDDLKEHRTALNQRLTNIEELIRNLIAK